MNGKLMKSSVRASLAALLIAAGLVPLIAGTQSSDLRGLERDAPGGKLEGAWNVTATACDNSVIAKRLITFMFGGTLQEFTALVSPLVPVRRGPGQGGWEHLTDGHYSYTVKFFVLNVDSTLAGWRIETRDVSVDVSGSTFTATGTSQLYDINGNPVGPSGCATETATRF